MTHVTIEKALDLALEALDNLLYWDNGKPEYDEAREAITTIKQALAAPTVQEPDWSNTLHFAQWTSGEKDLSNYILVGHLTLAGIEDGEYGQSEIESHENTIEALQEHLVTCSEHKTAPLLAYVGGLNTTPPAQPAPVQEPSEALRLAMDWYDSGHEDREEFKALMENLLTAPAAQRQWVGLTDEEFRHANKSTMNLPIEEVLPTFARAIEAKLKEKNNG